MKVSAHEAEAWLACGAVGITQATGTSTSLSAQIFTSFMNIRERVEEKVDIDDLSSPVACPLTTPLSTFMNLPQDQRIVGKGVPKGLLVWPFIHEKTKIWL